jgi:hypothetical protein
MFPKNLMEVMDCGDEQYVGMNLLKDQETVSTKETVSW